LISKEIRYRFEHFNGFRRYEMAKGPKPSVKVGDKFTTKEGYEVEVVEYNGAFDVIVKFGNGFEKRVEASHLRHGRVKNPFHRSVYGVGYYGDGVYKAKSEGKHTKAYRTWLNMFVRCYDEKELKRNPTYKECYVCEEWHNFQVFAKWFYQQPNHDKQGFDLDKDLIVLGNKIYGPDYCSFVPHQINTLLTGHGLARGSWPQGVCYSKRYKSYRAKVNKGEGKSFHIGSYSNPEDAFKPYAEEKEKFVKQRAEEYKNVIHPKVYENLMLYKVKPA